MFTSNKISVNVDSAALWITPGCNKEWSRKAENNILLTNKIWKSIKVHIKLYNLFGKESIN